MKKLLTLVTTLLLGSLSFAQNHNALRFRQPLAFHQYLIRDLHQQTLERDRSLSEALQKKKHYSHLTLDEAIEVSRRVGAKKTWFTHCSHSMGLAADVNRELPESMMLAYDGLKIVVNN